MAANLTIVKPRGAVFSTATKSGQMRGVLEWDDGFAPKMTLGFTQAQKYVDSEVLRFCSARVPFDTGMLQKSGVLGTVIGSGEVQYVAPYSAVQYYKTAAARSYDANRGAKWFERGKAAEGARILKGAQRIAGGAK